MSQGETRVRYETIVPRQESELFNTAVYRFLETRATAVDDLVKLQTEPRGEMVRKEVTLWSADAAGEFARYWREFPKRRL